MAHKKAKATTPPPKPAVVLPARPAGRACWEHPARHVFTLGTADVYGGGRGAAQAGAPWAFALMLAGDVVQGPCFVRGAPALATALAPWIVPPPSLAIAWADASVPALPVRAWEIIVAHLASLPGRVLVTCEGGHGRTGTALAILGALSGAIPKADDPVAWVRTNYCAEAIETPAQEYYVDAITDRPLGGRATTIPLASYRNDHGTVRQAQASYNDWRGAAWYDD